MKYQCVCDLFVYVYVYVQEPAPQSFKHMELDLQLSSSFLPFSFFVFILSSHIKTSISSENQSSFRKQSSLSVQPLVGLLSWQ